MSVTTSVFSPPLTRDMLHSQGFTVVVYTGVDKNTGQETIERVYCTSPLRISQGVI